MNTPAECLTEGFSQTACGFIVEFADLYYGTDSTLCNSGKCKINTEFLSINTKKLYDDFLAQDQIDSIPDDVDTSYLATKQLDYYAGKTQQQKTELTIYNYNHADVNSSIKSMNGTTGWWCLRSTYSHYDERLGVIQNDGKLYFEYSSSELGISPTFRIG